MYRTSVSSLGKRDSDGGIGSKGLGRRDRVGGNGSEGSGQRERVGGFRSEGSGLEILQKKYLSLPTSSVVL